MKRCPRCGAVCGRPGQKFCSQCGAPLSETPPQASPSWPPQQVLHRKHLITAALAVLVATMERELPGVLFCIFCGYLCDLYTVAPMGYYMFFLTVLGLICGLVIRNYLQPSLSILAGAVLITAFFCRVVLFLFRYSLAGVAGAAPVLLRYDLPHAVYSAVLAVPLYYPVRALHRMAEQRTDTRL